MHGHLVPPVSGEYTFAIASDNSGRLSLSSDHLPSNAKTIAFLDNWTAAEEWDKYPGDQQSEPIFLEGGKLYYISALQHEAVGGDNLAVGWKQPGQDNFSVIPGGTLIPFGDLPLIEKPAFASSSSAFTLPETAPVAHPLGTVSASHPDPGRTLTHTIVAGNTGNAFAIDSNTGELLLNAALDYETTPAYDLLVQASDDRPVPRSATIPVTISVSNVMETNAEVVTVALTQAGASYEGHGNPALIGFEADPDGDGIQNALEILHGLDPAANDTPPAIRMDRVSENGKTYLTYEVDVASGIAESLNFRFMGASDLKNWSKTGNTPKLISDDGSIKTYRVRDDMALEDAPSRFLQISLPTGETESP
jgi:hypothetical protein